MPYPLEVLTSQPRLFLLSGGIPFRCLYLDGRAFPVRGTVRDSARELLQIVFGQLCEFFVQGFNFFFQRVHATSAKGPFPAIFSGEKVALEATIGPGRKHIMMSSNTGRHYS